ncbi:MAG: Pyrophosphate--fructose 6-phosphate 1-phosphotransferase [Chlamydiales bacterium]|nr:Pyrophosphate--fructose 6-phosphate 1-phosphotransferase [Chlamydiales bacterium]MCH9620104.1 Pyrophosphate--fructose 6-phosphate 1-phosphotransferase [Chlamydiales bacterium]MCH9623574.1 Pyrophosphate--fructose 6-phosphate 1-phosphotransferase [Chlamydiales bacterium]
MESAFQEGRAQFNPELPNLLKGIKTLKLCEGESTSSRGDCEEIHTFFPKTFGQPSYTFELGTTPHPSEPLHVGVVLSGGQAPGGHNVITALFDALQTLHSESTLIGFLGGPSGIIDDKTILLTEEKIAPFRNMGGFDLIGSGRTKIESASQLEASLKTVLKNRLDGLVIVGGDDSNTNAAILAEYFLENGIKTRVVGVPKTIDGDLKNNFIETSFGFDTAAKIYSELISNIERDALSAKKYTHFIKLMGRSASHLTLECALRTHPNITVIGEEVAKKGLTLSQIVHQIADVISQRANRGKNFGVILLPEGLLEFIPQMSTVIDELNSGTLSAESEAVLNSLPQSIVEQLKMDRDPHGNIQLSHIQTERLLIHLVREELAQRSNFKGKFSAVSHFFGYEGRAAFPSNFDANYTYALGMTAAVLIDRGLTGYMAMVNQLTKPPSLWEVGGLPITMMMHMEKRKSVRKPVIQKALVDLEAEPFRYFVSQRDNWAIEDLYQFQGPIQYFGPEQITDETALTLKLEHHVPIEFTS